MKIILLTLLVTLGLSVHAEEGNSNAAKQPASAVAATVAASNVKAEEPIPCPLPGEPASNCPAPNRAADDTEGGVSYVARPVRLEIKPIILTTVGQNAHSNSQPLSPMRDVPKTETDK